MDSWSRSLQAPKSIYSFSTISALAPRRANEIVDVVARSVRGGGYGDAEHFSGGLAHWILDVYLKHRLIDSVSGDSPNNNISRALKDRNVRRNCSGQTHPHRKSEEAP